ncbi:accessory Sec system protein Asp3 [Pediococcus stilesii]|uniref:Accessory Sec system protein Asp3 n=1 Tax=Pediococcus stilesii TaxID=331679 RepID=A0A5R9BVX2_9LACO|nr:accessory Sec system protein Asp3 [Pediococcus stilesii]TLQ04824.1 accessory Sec system protein Asp3 [Pediococcus stilesii]
MTESYFVVKWPVFFDQTYNFGSKLIFSNGVVQFKNQQMSPGAKIHTWESKTNYLKSNRTLNLPLLKSGKEYQIYVSAKQIPKDSVHIQIDFFDAQNKTLDNLVLTEMNSIFKVPEKTDHYQISLINLNNQELKFEYIVINLLNHEYSIRVYSKQVKLVLVWNGSVIDKVTTVVRDRILDSGAYLGSENELWLYVEAGRNELKQSLILKLKNIVDSLISNGNLNLSKNLLVQTKFWTKNMMDDSFIKLLNETLVDLEGK